METRQFSKSVCVLWLLIYGIQWTVGFVDDETALKNRLLQNSGISYVRPERVSHVELSFNLLAINGVDIKNEQFMISGWWSMRWTDSRLSWAQTGPADIPVIQVSKKDIWTPALVVGNSVDDLSAIGEDSIPLRVQQDGVVTWNPPGILVLSCDMVVSYFPFDTQTCSIEVTSFGYTIDELDISVRSSLNLAYYQSNGEWTILKTWTSRYEYTDDDHNFAKVIFHVKLQRRAAYYGLNTMLPVLLSSLLIPLVFLLPHDCDEKVVYCLTVLLAYVVLLTIVTDGLPTTAENQSLLGVYIAIVLTLAAIAVFLAIHSLNIFHRNPLTPIPDWQATLTRRTQWIIGIKCGSKNKGHGTISSAGPNDDSVEENGRRPNRENTARGSVVSTRREDGISSSHINAEVADGAEEKPMTWRLVAQTYDAFFLRVYFIVIVCCSLILMLIIASNQFLTD